MEVSEVDQIVSEALLRVAARLERDQRLRLRSGEKRVDMSQAEAAISNIISALRVGANIKKER